MVHRQHSHKKVRDILEGFFVFNLLLDDYSPHSVQREPFLPSKTVIRNCDSHLCLVCNPCTLNQAVVMQIAETERSG